VKDVKKPIQTTIFDIKPKSCFNHVNIVEYLSIPTFEIDYKKNKVKFLEEIKEKYNKKDVLQIKEALRFAEKIHENQKRDTGEPYISHPLSVASYVMEAGFNAQTVITALLHDVIEDSNIQPKEITKIFGGTVSKSVVCLTKPKLYKGEWIFAESSKYFNCKDEYKDLDKEEKVKKYDERNDIYYPKIYESDSFIPFFVKIFDNIHNVETCEIHHSKKQLRTARIVATKSLLYMTKLLGFENEKMKKILETLNRIIPDFNLEEHIGKIKHSKPVIKLPLRTEKTREMFLKMSLPEMENISLYGTPEQAYLMGFIEVGLPKKEINYIELLKEKMKEFDVEIYEGRSQLPTEIGASEKIIVLKVGEPKIEKRGRKYKLIGTNLKVNLSSIDISNKNDEDYLKIKEIYNKLYSELKEIHKKIKNN
jgi:hypothetical protein